MSINTSVLAYIHWLQSRGQVWPSLSNMDAEFSKPTQRQNDGFEISSSVSDTTPTKLAKHVIFISCESLSPSGENMRANLLKALKVTDYEWLHAETGDAKPLVEQLNSYQANYIIAFGSLAGELFAGKSLTDDELPIKEHKADHCLLLVPSITSMLAQPKRKIAVWNLFQACLLPQKNPGLINKPGIERNKS
ncbi:MAG: hypothetical protein ACOH5I_05155 [Oligoflexus sp.]